ncbi:ATP-binding protein [Streptomyces sp. VNUA116]|uniref:ATP-binding protein n=1 Tax=Streptomyces sp. VNUA116 TaxID=3062449 RepID=UPI002675E1F0|nr:ATP-binding protein [Streptomyces sp. VNUA116]WKU47076.1 ATP-binding protein [Streptomyces sp. VNUA116]
MDPTNRPDAFGEGAHESADARDPRDLPGTGAGDAGRPEDAGQGAPGLARVVRLVAGDYAVTVNPVDGSEIEPCLPADVPPPPGRHTPDERAELLRAAAPPPPARQAGPELPLLHRQEERERLARLLSRGRSVRLTGPAGSGRSSLLDAVAEDCAGLAPDGVVRLTGYHRTVTDVLYDLFAAVHHAPQHRPDRAALLGHVREIGAVVVLDDLEFGGAALDELLDATPECAFLFSATPDVAAPSADSHVEEVFLGGLDRTACLELLELCVDRPPTDEEAGWAADLWFESEGLPLRFVQAGALLRLGAPPADGRGSEAPAADSAADEFGVVAERPYVAAAEAEAGTDHGGTPLPSLAEACRPAVPLASRLGDAARDTLRFAVALGGEVPHQAHLPALVGDTHADAAVGELLASGLITTVAGHYRLAAGVAAQLTAEGYGSGAAERAHAAAQHYAWWSGHPSVTPERAAAEADAILATLAALAAEGDPAHRAAAVLLARTAAPAFAAALHWSAWERVLRYGQEAARRAGEVGEEAYFHHELGVLALCTGNLQRARAELEASVGMRGVMADKRGAIAGRRALALVADRSGFTPAGPAGSPAGGPSAAAPRPDAGRPGAAPPVAPPAVPRPSGGPAGRTPAGEEIPAARSEQSAVPPSVPASAAPAAPGSGADPDQVATTVIARLAAERDRKQRGPARQPWARQMMMGGARRNLVAAGAGALLAAVLGTVVTLGITSGGQDGKSPERVKPGQSASQQDGDNGLTADQRDPGEAGHAQVPGKPGKPGRSPGAGSSGSASPGASGSTSPSGAPSTSGEPSTPPSSDGTSPSPSHSPSGKPSHSTPPSGGSSGGSTSGGSGQPSSKPPTSAPPSSGPSQPTGGGSNSASGPTSGGSSSQSAASGPSGSKPADGSGAGSVSPSTSGA